MSWLLPDASKTWEMLNAILLPDALIHLIGSYLPFLTYKMNWKTSGNVNPHPPTKEECYEHFGWVIERRWCTTIYSPKEHVNSCMPKTRQRKPRGQSLVGLWDLYEKYPDYRFPGDDIFKMTTRAKHICVYLKSTNTTTCYAPSSF